MPYVSFVARVVADVVAVCILAILLPVILVVSVLLAVYGDITKKRNQWTGLEPPDLSREYGSRLR